jgi:hypothetical protein
VALPGVQAVIKDGFYNLQPTNIPTGPRLLIIGKRTTDNGTGDVADLDPYFASREDNVIEAFGEGSDLHRGFVEAGAGGASRIFLVALPSDTEFDYGNGTISSANYDVETGGDVDLFDAAFEAAEVVRPDVIVPWGRGSDSLEWESPATPSNDPEHFGFYADNSATKTDSFAYKVAQKCYNITSQSHPVFAVLGVKPYVGTSENMIPSEVASHLELPNLIARSEMTDYGRYLVVVAGELRPVGYGTFGYSNGASMLAADIIRRNEWNSPTNQTIFNLTALRYAPAKAKQQSLIDKAVVPVSVGYNRIPIWVDVMTFSPIGSDYARLTTIRIVFAAIQVARSAAGPFIGQAATLDTRNALETQVTSGLRAMQQQGALYASTPSFTYNAATNEVIIDLVLVPAFELRSVEVRVSVNLNSAV